MDLNCIAVHRLWGESIQYRHYEVHSKITQRGKKGGRERGVVVTLGSKQFNSVITHVSSDVIGTALFVVGTT